MKKLVSLVLVMLLTFSLVYAKEDVPEFLYQNRNNYTASYNISVNFDNPEEVEQLLSDIEASQQIENFVDVSALLKTLCSGNQNMKIQSDISDDYKKIKLSMVSKSSKYIEVNRNLNIDINSNYGMWMDIDLTDKDNMMFDMIYETPFMNKYFRITQDDILNEDETGEIPALFDKIFDKQYIQSLNKKTVDIFSKYADIKGSGNKYIATIDNDAFTEYADELIATTNEETTKLMGEDYQQSQVEMPSVKDWQILGKDGIRCEFVLKGGKISAENIYMDISVDVPSIYQSITGEQWQYDAVGTVDFTINVTSDYSKVGITKVDFPKITSENSFTISDMESAYEYEQDDEYFPEYPMWYADAYTPELPVVGDDIYVPLRTLLECAYEDSVYIEYADGVITAKSEFFDGFDSIIIDVESNVVIAGDNVYEFGKPVVIDGTTYVNKRLFTDVFRWELSEAIYDMLADEYYISFYTRAY